MKNKRGVNLLAGNIVFIILNVVFIIILASFLVSKISNPAVMEEKYSKEIAFSLDSARPGMVLTFNMKDAVDVAKKNLGEKNLGQIVQINGNLVTVKLQDGKGYTYSFFNNVNITGHYLDEATNSYLFFIGGYK